MKNIIEMTLKLLIITVVAGLVLGVVYGITKDPIAAQEKAEADAARSSAFPAAPTFEQMNIEIPEEYAIIENVYAAKDADGNDLGITAAIKTKGFNAGLKMTVGVSADGMITGIVVGSHQETPGLGAKATDAAFSDQYKDKPYDNGLVVVKTAPQNANEIQSITGATITSKGITEAVNKAAQFYTDVIGGAQ